MERNNETSLSRPTAERWTNERLASLNPGAEWEPNVARGLALLRDRRHPEKRRRAKKYSWLAGGIAVGVPLMAMPATRALAHRCVSACVSESGWVRELVTGTLPTAQYISAENRKLAPDFTLTDASGQAVTLSALRGKVVLLNFWATWCGPCQIEIPWFVEMAQANRDAGLEVVGVSMDEDGWQSVRPYIQARKVNYTVVTGNQDIAQLYDGVPSLPATFIIDRSGRIAAVHVGLCSKHEYESDIAAVMREQ